MEVRKVTKDDIHLVVSLNDTVQRIHAEAHPHIFKYPTDSMRWDFSFLSL
ncbi:MAG TPA: hypothetical protein VEB00_00805 [Clostridia bacterium]|nr:hypothetical protein [Clostridia bacterium]